MGISFLTILVFYLPSDSGEKVSESRYSTPVLNSFGILKTVFFLLKHQILILVLTYDNRKSILKQ